MTAAHPTTATILFSDLVNSTELLQRVGDETAQRVFETHHRLLRDALSAHGGAEVKWTGDGLIGVLGISPISRAIPSRRRQR